MDRVFNAVMLPILNVGTGVFMRRFTKQCNADTHQAHAEAFGTHPYNEQWLQEHLEKTRFTIVVFYRGLW